MQSEAKPSAPGRRRAGEVPTVPEPRSREAKRIREAVKPFVVGAWRTGATMAVAERQAKGRHSDFQKGATSWRTVG